MGAPTDLNVAAAKVTHRDHSMANTWFSGASKALQKFSEHTAEGIAALSSLAVGDASRETSLRVLEFREGPLGFDLEGARVTYVEPADQAASLGVSVGDRVVAVEGQGIPGPPPDSSDVEHDTRIKKLIRTWIKQRDRPVRIAFSVAPSDGGNGHAVPSRAQRSAVREIEFKDGPLGFELQGALVTSIEDQGQAASLDLQIGDR